VKGRLILIPTLNQPAVRASTRLSPIDGKNLNRAFPGSPEGTVTEQIADYLTRVLLPLSESVIDIHSGGRGVQFYPCTQVNVVSDQQQMKAMIDAAEAWNADFVMFYLTNIAGTGLLAVEASRQGKIVLGTELGGGEWYPADVHQLAQRGLRNVLIHLGVLEGKEETRASLGKPPARIIRSLNKEDYIMAPGAGFFEPLVDLGSYVNRGTPVGELHFLERPDQPAEIIAAQSEGYLISFRAPCLTQQGDCVAVTAQEFDPNSLFLT
jgi:N-alpha-acetyl-L-2,4-diaminobutyrate deacetylase